MSEKFYWTELIYMYVVDFLDHLKSTIASAMNRACYGDSAYFKIKKLLQSKILLWSLN